jgi:hypothetical protein
MTAHTALTAPRFKNEDIREVAAHHDVCVRPVLRKVTDRETGHVHKLTIPCGSTREYLCPPCAKKAQRLRMQQCAEGWHLEEEVLPDQPDAGLDGEDPGDGPQDDGEHSSRRVRSTRRRCEMADLPKVPAEHRSIGKAFTTPDGKSYRPSMFVTVTLPSYGKVVSYRKGHRVPGAGAPLDPDRYNYRRAALDALHFPRLFDRWMQNLRRCAGFKVQYFAAIEEQLRLAPHAHIAMRGAIPRAVLRQVTRATYFALWWPPHDRPVYVHRTPAWDPADGCYRDPDTGFPLPTWEQALAELDHDQAEPAHVMRFGAQVDIKGVIAPSEDANRTIRYLTKYLTKSVAETHADPDRPDPAYEAHIDRLHREVLFLPCSEQCANWLRFGIQPKNPGPGLTPGMCPGKAHDRENLGLGGRRVQVSRHWSGKTLAQHRADRAEVVRQVLEASGITPPERDRWSAEVLTSDGGRRFVWEDMPVDDADYIDVVMASVVEQHRWRREYQTARARWEAARASPVDTNSATWPAGDSTGATTAPRPPDSQPTQVA